MLLQNRKSPYFQSESDSESVHLDEDEMMSTVTCTMAFAWFLHLDGTRCLDAHSYLDLMMAADSRRVFETVWLLQRPMMDRMSLERMAGKVALLLIAYLSTCFCRSCLIIEKVQSLAMVWPIPIPPPLRPLFPSWDQ